MTKIAKCYAKNLRFFEFLPFAQLEQFQFVQNYDLKRQKPHWSCGYDSNTVFFLCLLGF